MIIPNWLKVLLTFLAGVAAALAAVFLRKQPTGPAPADTIVSSADEQKAAVDQKVASDTDQQLADDFNKANQGGSK
jgi:hypothetical protein